jgi:hypothetical protein
MSRKNNNLTKTVLADEFNDALEYDETTAPLLSEAERYYADQLIKRGLKVRFNEIHILSQGESQTVFSILRSNIAEL